MVVPKKPWPFPEVVGSRGGAQHRSSSGHTGRLGAEHRLGVLLGVSHFWQLPAVPSCSAPPQEGAVLELPPLHGAGAGWGHTGVRGLWEPLAPAEP